MQNRWNKELHTKTELTGVVNLDSRVTTSITPCIPSVLLVMFNKNWYPGRHRLSSIKKSQSQYYQILLDMHLTFFENYINWNILPWHTIHKNNKDSTKHIKSCHRHEHLSVWNALLKTGSQENFKNHMQTATCKLGKTQDEETFRFV